MRARKTWKLLPLIAAVFAGCAGSDAMAGGAEIRDSAGVALVRIPTELVNSSRTPRLTPDLRIGVVDGAPEYQFARITRIAEGSNGQIYVLDRDPLREFLGAGCDEVEDRPGAAHRNRAAQPVAKTTRSTP